MSRFGSLHTLFLCVAYHDRQMHMIAVSSVEEKEIPGGFPGEGEDKGKYVRRGKYNNYGPLGFALESLNFQGEGKHKLRLCWFFIVINVSDEVLTNTATRVYVYCMFLIMRCLKLLTFANYNSPRCAS